MSNMITSDVQSAAHDNIERTMSGLKDGVASATAGMEQAHMTMREGMQKAVTTTGEVVAFTQGNVEALTRSSQILATGMQGLGQSVAASARASIEDTVSTFKALATAKSFKEVMDLQTSLFRSMLQRAMTNTSQMTASSMKLPEQAMAPIAARLSMAAQKFGRTG